MYSMSSHPHCEDRLREHPCPPVLVFAMLEREFQTANIVSDRRAA
jgi:hypothetical protein